MEADFKDYLLLIVYDQFRRKRTLLCYILMFGENDSGLSVAKILRLKDIRSINSLKCQECSFLPHMNLTQCISMVDKYGR